MENVKIRNKLLVVLILFAFVLLSLNSFADSMTLSLYFERQQQTNWCWAATSQSIINKIAGRTPTQTQIVTNIFGSSVNKPVTTPQDQQSLAAWGVGSYLTGQYQPIAFSTLSGNIKSGKPMKAEIYWTSGGGHVLVINGYYENGTDKQIYYLDPWPSNPLLTAVRYDNFCNNSTYKLAYQMYYCYKTY